MEKKNKMENFLREIRFIYTKKLALSCQLFIMTSLEGIEPTTHSLGGCRSILLSYRDTMYYCLTATLRGYNMGRNM